MVVFIRFSQSARFSRHQEKLTENAYNANPNLLSQKPPFPFPISQVSKHPMPPGQYPNPKTPYRSQNLRSSNIPLPCSPSSCLHTSPHPSTSLKPYARPSLTDFKHDTQSRIPLISLQLREDRVTHVRPILEIILHMDHNHPHTFQHTLRP